MDQKNTIVKCKVHPDCLFNHNGVCDNYVINIGADGSCQEYVETEWLEQNKEYYDSCFYCQHALHEKNNKWLYCKIDGLKIDRALRSDQCKQFQSVYSRGQRAKYDFYTDGWADLEIVKEVCQPFTMSKHLCDTKCKYWQLDSYSEWVCGCMAEDFNPRGYCPYYDDGGEE